MSIMDYIDYGYANRCVCCGEVIPEGRQVCKLCELNERPGKTKMTLKEKLEMQAIIITSNLSDEKIGRLNDLMNMAFEEMKQEGREEAASEFALESIKAYYDDILDEPEIHRIERQIKEQKNE